MNIAYRLPLLVSALRAFGWLGLLATAGLLFFAYENFSAASVASPVPDASGNWQFFARLCAALTPAGAALAVSFVCFGVGQVIDHLAQIAHAARRFCEQHESLHFKPAASSSKAIPIPPLRLFQAQDARETSEGDGSGPERRLFRCRLGGIAFGPVDEAELQRLVDAGEIDHDTEIRLEGTAEWQRLEDMAEG